MTSLMTQSNAPWEYLLPSHNRFYKFLEWFLSPKHSYITLFQSCAAQFGYAPCHLIMLLLFHILPYANLPHIQAYIWIHIRTSGLQCRWVQKKESDWFCGQQTAEAEGHGNWRTLTSLSFLSCAPSILESWDILLQWSMKIIVTKTYFWFLISRL